MECSVHRYRSMLDSWVDGQVTGKVEGGCRRGLQWLTSTEFVVDRGKVVLFLIMKLHFKN